VFKTTILTEVINLWFWQVLEDIDNSVKAGQRSEQAATTEEVYVIVSQWFQIGQRRGVRLRQATPRGGHPRSMRRESGYGWPGSVQWHRRAHGYAEWTSGQAGWALVTAVSSYWKYGQRLSGRSRRPVTGPVLWLQCADVPMPASAVDGLPMAGQ